jgi:limonene 1,2-monooxygenase
MIRMRFGTFLAPHHPIGEDPTLLLHRDLELARHLDQLGFDEFWVGEHHSTGWEIISSPEMFLAAAAQNTHRIGLGTGVVSLPYHHPFHVANRIVLLDHLSNGRALFGSGPGAIPTDQWTLGLDPMLLRDRHDEALGVILRLLSGEGPLTHESDWFTMRDARLQLLPKQEHLPIVVSSALSPSGMTLAGKYGVGVLSIASNSTEGIQALPTQWSFAQKSALASGKSVCREDWRVVLVWHVAETRAQAEREVADGLFRWHNDYKVNILQRPGDLAVSSAEELLEQYSDGGPTGIGAAIVGTPDDLVNALIRLRDFTGGFGVALGFAHDWASPENTRKSWDLVARYVVPAVNGTLLALNNSADFVRSKMPSLVSGMTNAVMAKIMENEEAAKAFAVTQELKQSAPSAAFRPGMNLATERVNP